MATVSSMVNEFYEPDILFRPGRLVMLPCPVEKTANKNENMAVDTKNNQKSPIVIAGPKDYTDKSSLDNEDPYGSSQLQIVVICVHPVKLLCRLVADMNSLFMH